MPAGFPGESSCRLMYSPVGALAIYTGLSAAPSSGERGTPRNKEEDAKKRKLRGKGSASPVARMAEQNILILAGQARIAGLPPLLPPSAASSQGARESGTLFFRKRGGHLPAARSEGQVSTPNEFPRANVEVGTKPKADGRLCWQGDRTLPCCLHAFLSSCAGWLAGWLASRLENARPRHPGYTARYCGVSS